MSRITRRYVGQDGIPGDQWYPYLQDGRLVLGFGDSNTAKANPVLVDTEDEAVALIRTRHRPDHAWVRMTVDGGDDYHNLIVADNLLIDGEPV